MQTQTNPTQLEQEIQSYWKTHDIFKYNKDNNKPLYAIDTPPPTVSGSLHMGHIFSYVQAEMIARFKRMQGFNIFYPFGFDDNGLPTERLVEKEIGVYAKDLPRSVFSDKCQTTAQHYEQEFRALWESLGFSVDWSLQYETINPTTQRISQRSFLELLKMGKAYAKSSPVLWCTECQTSIAQADLESSEKESAFHTILFDCEGEKIQIATTRPEFLSGCVSLFVNASDDRYKHLHGKMAQVPLFTHTVPILVDEKADPNKGTGIVMCCTFGDQTDMDWYQRHNLPYREVLLPDGTLSPEIPWLGGLKVNAARKLTLELLSDQGLLIDSKIHQQAVAVHERCGKPIEIIPSKQWYIDILTDQARYLQAADEINWYPAHMKQRYTSWVENLKWDWCISRQRYFGVPFPIWYCKACGTVNTAEESQLPVNPLETQPLKPCQCGCNDFEPETAVFDTWATSSVTPLINAKWGEPDEKSELLPMTMRTQAHEIIRTWAFYTIVKSLYHTGQLPWKDIMVCGFVLAKKGEKISKSKNNSKQTPSALIETHSADAIRYWAANAKLGTDTFFAEEELAISKRFLNKFKNASRFAFSHLEDFDPNWQPTTDDLLPIDRWLLARCQMTTQEAKAALDQYEIGTARHAIDELFWKDFCDYYLEIVKERLYQGEKHGWEARKSAQYALYHGLLCLLKLYAIYVPHLTESLYLSHYKAFEEVQSLHLMTWATDLTYDPNLIAFGETIKNSISEVRKYKSENNLSLKAEIPLMTLPNMGDHQHWLTQTLADLKACCNAGEIILM